ncbi:sigma-54-dependent Fis family transcriptional regulator [Paraburkholderia silvatlantica]|uniref:sigma-54-dependent Fis family transcriptional regulator n=1 Tax=Paraburkholderia silvatlantica TaxID=321895 RepID=UPI001061B29C|nr:sigma 54-interacting transcriptional regulator [Paraburkholderia silvatlantica]TDQ89398.1 Fis family NifA subfamily transcriptional regulator [Paraburkholderia silvatlantica]
MAARLPFSPAADDGADRLVPSSARADLDVEVHIDVNWASQELFFRRELAKVAGRFSNSEENLREVFHLLSEILGLNRGRLFLADAAGKLTLRCAYGLTRGEMARGVFAPGEGMTGRVFLSGQLTIVQDIDSEPSYLWRTVARSALPNGTTSMFFVPIRVGGETRGVFIVNRFRGISRSLTSDLEILREVATQVSQLLRLDDLIAERVQTHTAALEQENHTLKLALNRHSSTYGIIGGSKKIRAAVRQVEQVAQSDATVLLLGESGTGKERFAHAVHFASSRRAYPFVRVNCGALPEALFESELFGHEKGAFTGATRARSGRFEEAHGGTLFLDEIGELPLNLQVKLLRVLQERCVTPLGGRDERRVDVRVVAATNLDLRQRVAQGMFRLDLFYRIYVVPIHLPPLREHPEDVAPLVEHFLRGANARFKRKAWLSGAALSALIHYPWPGNVRQLQNVIDRLTLLADSPAIGAGEVMAILETEGGLKGQERDRSTEEAGAHFALSRRIDYGQRENIEAALVRAGGVKSRAAQQIGLTLSQFNYRIRLLQIDVQQVLRNTVLKNDR